MIVVLLFFSAFVFVSFTSRIFVNPAAGRLYQQVACVIILFAFFGFRDITILNDTPHYYGTYYQYARYNGYVDSSIFTYRLAMKFEWGFQVLLHILMKYFSKDPYTIIWLSSLFFSFGNIWFLSKMTKDIALGAFLLSISGVYFDQYSMIRQAIAIMIFYKAYFFLQESKTLKYCVLILFASLFHTSALMLLLLPLLIRLRICKRNVALLFFIAVLIALFIYKLLSLIGMAGHIYIKTSMKRDAPPIAALLDGTLMFIMVGMCIYLHRKMKIASVNNINFWICTLGLSICIMTPAFLPIFRFNAYCWPFVYSIFFKYVNSRHNIAETDESKKLSPLRNIILILFVFVILTRIIIILLFKSEWNHIVPYSFYDFSGTYHYYNIYYEKE